MGFEYRITFADPDWYAANRDRVAERIRLLPHLTEEVLPDEFRFKDEEIPNAWTYDLRLFLVQKGVAVEVSVTTASFHEDVRDLFRWIRLQTPVEMVDDDGLQLSGW